MRLSVIAVGIAVKMLVRTHSTLPCVGAVSPMSRVMARLATIPNLGTPGFRSRRALWGYATAVLVIIADQWSKFLASSQLEYRIPVEITGWFDLLLAHNTGAAFSFLADAGGWQKWFFSVVALTVSGVMLVWLSR